MEIGREAWKLDVAVHGEVITAEKSFGCGKKLTGGLDGKPVNFFGGERIA